MGEDRLTELESVRDLLRDALTSPTTPLQSLAGLSREFRAVLDEIEMLTAEGSEVDAVDDLTARRAARHAGTADPPSAARRSQPRRREGSQRSG